jgi:hypothetical protein
MPDPVTPREVGDTPRAIRYDYCDECKRFGKPFEQATWAFRVMGPSPKSSARLLTCDRHAEFYRRQGDSIYPSERLAVS